MVAQIAEVRALVHDSCAAHDPRRRAFIAALYERYRRSLVWYLTRLIPNRADAEDVAQEAFARLLAVAHLETDATRARNYLFATATNLARDNYRRRTARADGAHVPLDERELEAQDPQPERVIDAERGCRILYAALGELKPRPRQGFLMYVQHELTYERIARELGVSKKTIERDVAHTIALCQARLARWAEA